MKDVRPRLTEQQLLEKAKRLIEQRKAVSMSEAKRRVILMEEREANGKFFGK